MAVVARSVEAKEEEVLGTDEAPTDLGLDAGGEQPSPAEPAGESVEGVAGATIETTTENTDPDTTGESEA